MITLITGAPGAGKSAALVDLLTSECARRALYVDGIPELKVPHVALEKPREWMTEVEDGAAIVIDEVQRVWRPRGNGSTVPADIAALETHRHKGLDFYIVTQHPNLIDANVRRLVGRHVHLRDLGILGRWWYEWPEASNPETWKSAPIKKHYSLPKKAFGLYKSASMHVKPVRSIPRQLITFGVCMVIGPLLAWKVYKNINERLTPTPSKVQAEAPGHPLTDAMQAGLAAGAPRAATQTADPLPPATEPARPEVVGCFSSAKTCRCFDKKGFPVIVDWELCKTSAYSYAGLVPLDLTPRKPETLLTDALTGGAGVQPQGRPKAGSQQTMAGL